MERRNTIQKDLVLSAVMKMHHHVTADEIYEFISRDHPSIGRGTVYRNLGKLVEENKVRKVDVPDGPSHYDFRLDRHYHVRCIKCGRLFDIDMDENAGLETHIKDKHGILFLDYDILFKGICPSCQEHNSLKSHLPI